MESPLHLLADATQAGVEKDAPFTRSATVAGGRNYVKKTMEEKMSNKGWADGLRTDVLGKYLPRFKAAWFGVSRETEVAEVSS